jgi:hypothetical protein
MHVSPPITVKGLERPSIDFIRYMKKKEIGRKTARGGYCNAVCDSGKEYFSTTSPSALHMYDCFSELDREKIPGTSAICKRLRDIFKSDSAGESGKIKQKSKREKGRAFVGREKVFSAYSSCFCRTAVIRLLSATFQFPFSEVHTMGRKSAKTRTNHLERGPGQM